MSFLLDTDTCSAYLKGNKEVFNRFLQYMGGLHVSAVTVGELYTWVLRSKAPPSRLRALTDMLTDMRMLNATHDIARKFGEIRADLLDRGLPPPDMDLFNAATALVHDLTLVTHNAQDYASIPGLRIADWVAA
jgi:tRNA(fMet)-specific endonuclease VapC